MRRDESFSISETTFGGLRAYQILTRDLELVAVSEIGPRIAHLGFRNGANVLFWDAEVKYRRNDWFLRGGHRVWITRPGADEPEETYAEDNDPCSIEVGKNKIKLTAPPHSKFGIQKAIEIEIISDHTFHVASIVTNSGEMLWCGGVWALTATAPSKNTTYEIPLGDGTAWDVFTLVIPKTWAGHNSPVNDPQLSFTEDVLLIKPDGDESKRMIQAPQGVIRLRDESKQLTFTKRAPYFAAATYPLNTNIAFYIGPDNFMVEMETMSPQQTLKPGESLIHIEEWSLE